MRMTKRLFLICLALGGAILSGMATCMALVSESDVARFLWFTLAACGWSLVLGGLATWAIIVAARFYDRLPDR